MFRDLAQSSLPQIGDFFEVLYFIFLNCNANCLHSLLVLIWNSVFFLLAIILKLLKIHSTSLTRRKQIKITMTVFFTYKIGYIIKCDHTLCWQEWETILSSPPGGAVGRHSCMGGGVLDIMYQKFKCKTLNSTPWELFLQIFLHMRTKTHVQGFHSALPIVAITSSSLVNQ